MRRVIPRPYRVIQAALRHGAHREQPRRGGQAVLPRNTVNDTRSREIGNPDLVVPLGIIKFFREEQTGKDAGTLKVLDFGYCGTDPHARMHLRLRK
jgi:hypothetical protein